METSEIVDLAGKLNKEVTDNKKVLDGYKAQLKDLGQEVMCGSDFKAEVTIRETQKFNQERLLKKVKDIKADWLLKQVVDEDLLESEIITGKLNAEDFVDCVDTSTTKAIKFKKIKKERENK